MWGLETQLGLCRPLPVALSALPKPGPCPAVPSTPSKGPTLAEILAGDTPMLLTVRERDQDRAPHQIRALPTLRPSLLSRRPCPRGSTLGREKWPPGLHQDEGLALQQTPRTTRRFRACLGPSQDAWLTRPALHPVVGPSGAWLLGAPVAKPAAARKPGPAPMAWGVGRTP